MANKYDMNAYLACFEYLDDLRESGITNMFGAAEYLVESELCEGRKDSKDMLMAWMKNCDGVSSVEDRAKRAYEAQKGNY